MPQTRVWRESDLPQLQQMAMTTAWNITPNDDRPHTSEQTVKESAVRNLYAVLGSQGGTAIVADADGRAVGYLLIAIQADDKTGAPHGYLADIYVEQEFRRSGVSKELHRAGEEYLRSIGVRRATNWTHAHNQLGLSASMHHGYLPWGIMMVKQLRPAADSVPTGGSLVTGQGSAT